MSALYAWLRRHPRMVDGVLAAVLTFSGLSTAIFLRHYLYIPLTLALTVTDDGIGAAAACDGAGHGVTGMRERVAHYGGTLAIGPLHAGGFQVRAALPTCLAQAGAA